MSHLHALGMLLGRILLSLIFILAGVGKFMDYNATVQYMAAKGMTMVPLFLVVAALIEIIAGLLVFFGIKARLGAFILFLYLIPVTLLFHDFWNQQGPERQENMINFMKNLAILGGLLYVICVGAGRWSLDACCNKHSDKT